MRFCLDIGGSGNKKFLKMSKGGIFFIAVPFPDSSEASLKYDQNSKENIQCLLAQLFSSS